MNAHDKSIALYHFAQGWREAAEHARGKQTRHAVDLVAQNHEHYLAGVRAGAAAFRIFSEIYDGQPRDEWGRMMRGASVIATSDNWIEDQVRHCGGISPVRPDADNTITLTRDTAFEGGALGKFFEKGGIVITNGYRIVARESFGPFTVGPDGALQGVPIKREG